MEASGEARGSHGHASVPAAVIGDSQSQPAASVAAVCNPTVETMPTTIQLPALSHASSPPQAPVGHAGEQVQAPALTLVQSSGEGAAGSPTAAAAAAARPLVCLHPRSQPRSCLLRLSRSAGEGAEDIRPRPDQEQPTLPVDGTRLEARGAAGEPVQSGPLSGVVPVALDMDVDHTTPPLHP